MATCGYLQFTESYDVPAQHAKQQGWAFEQIDAGHFQMLNDPMIVSEKLIHIGQLILNAISDYNYSECS